MILHSAGLENKKFRSIWELITSLTTETVSVNIALDPQSRGDGCAKLNMPINLLHHLSQGWKTKTITEAAGALLKVPTQARSSAIRGPILATECLQRRP